MIQGVSASIMKIRMSHSIATVAVFAPVKRLFDYLIPDAHSPRLSPGMRVRVPFGRGCRIGLVVRRSARSKLDLDRLKPIEKVLDSQPLIGGEMLDFYTWVSTYYHCPIGELVATALPVRLRQGKPVATDKVVAVQLTEAGRQTPPEALKRARKQREILAYLQAGAASLSLEPMRERFAPLGASLKALVDKGYVEWLTRPPALATQFGGGLLTLHDEQLAAVRAILDGMNAYVPFLLDGITGSGKTEVYLRVIAHVLEQGRQAMVLVPEIGLTPQLVERFERRFGACLAVSHSAMSHGDRESAWRQAAEGRARILIGTRSAVFTPMPNLGLIIVDEEHDSSYKQQDGCRYSARDLAIVRARRCDCAVVLGSATPSFESLHNTQNGRYRHLRLTQRAAGAKPPRIRLLDARGLKSDQSLTRSFLEAMHKALDAGNQVLLFVNRRGYAPIWTCFDCNWIAECRRCDARMTVHLKQNLLWCHHCGLQQALPRRCPKCDGENLNPLGQGTQRSEETLRQLFPEVAVARIDRDSVRGKQKLEKTLAEIHKGKHSLLIGTQLLSKGHHFPNVTLVGMPDIDQGLFSVDFRATERLAQLIVQVSGRSGREEKKGEVLIQTRYPEHPMLHLLLEKGYAAFARQALRERREAGFPPFSHQVLLRASAISQGPPMAFLQEARDCLRDAGESSVEVWGPVVPPMEKRAGRFRAQLLLQSSSRGCLHSLLDAWLPKVEKLKLAHRVRWSVDVDPLDLY